MAVTTAGIALSEAHRVAQARIAAAATVDLVRIWPALDPLDLDATSPRWLQLAIPTIERHRRRSQELARTYYGRLRQAEAPEVEPLPVVGLRPLPTNRVATSLLVTGPISIKRGVSAEVAQAAQAAAGARQALSGGREVIDDTIRADPSVKRVRRLTAPGCCAFCAMLATRDQLPPFFGGHFFRAHDNCHCQPEPAWDDGAGQSARSAEFSRIYRESTDGVGSSGNQKLNAFRQALAAERAG